MINCVVHLDERNRDDTLKDAAFTYKYKRISGVQIAYKRAHVPEICSESSLTLSATSSVLPVPNASFITLFFPMNILESAKCRLTSLRNSFR